jgi:AraC-like DNA-binding protein
MLVSVVFVRGIYAELQRRGLDAEAWLNDAGVDQGTLSDLRAMVDVQTWDSLLLRAEELLNDPGLGLTLGFGEHEGMLQLLGYLLASSRNLAEAVEMCQRYSSLVVDSLRVELINVGQVSHFRFHFHHGAHEASLRFGEELVMAIAFRLGKRHASPQHLREVRFRQPRPAYADRFTEHFGVPVQFGQDESEIMFDRGILHVAQPHGDALVVESLALAADKLLREIHASPALSERVRALLDHEPELGSIDADLIAAKMGMNARTLRRRLRAEGIGIRELIDESRMRAAFNTLLHPNATIKDTADRLGYSEPSAFHRAFKRWTGRTPSEYLRHDPDEADADDGSHSLSRDN